MKTQEDKGVLLDRAILVEKTKDSKSKDWYKLYRRREKLERSKAYKQAKLFDECRSTLEKLRILDKPFELLAMAKDTQADFQWALYKLQKFPEQYLLALEFWLTASKGEWARQVYKEIARVNPARAKEMAKKFGKFDKDLSVPSIKLLDETSRLSPEKRRAALIKVLLDPTQDFSLRSSAIDLLVPKENPLKDPSEEIDSALIHLLEPKLADETINYSKAHACWALARRGRIEYFDAMYKNMIESSSMVYNEMFEALVFMASKPGAEAKKVLLQKEIEANLYKSNRSIPALLCIAYALDLRELKPRIEALATSSSLDYDSHRASSSGGEESLVTQRFHLARHIASLWNEKDLLTRAKLLLIFSESVDRHSYLRDGKILQQRLYLDLKNVKGHLSPSPWMSLKEFSPYWQKFLDKEKQLAEK